MKVGDIMKVLGNPAPKAAAMVLEFIVQLRKASGTQAHLSTYSHVVLESSSDDSHLPL